MVGIVTILSSYEHKLIIKEEEEELEVLEWT